MIKKYTALFLAVLIFAVAFPVIDASAAGVENPIYEGNERIFAYNSATVNANEADNAISASNNYIQWILLGVGSNAKAARLGIVDFSLEKIPAEVAPDAGNIYLQFGSTNSDKNKMLEDYTIKLYGVEIPDFVKSQATYNNTLKNKELIYIDELTNDDVFTIGNANMLKFTVTDYVNEMKAAGKTKVTFVLEMQVRDTFLNFFVGCEGNTNPEIRPTLIPTKIDLDENADLKSITLSNGTLAREFNPDITAYDIKAENTEDVVDITDYEIASENASVVNAFLSGTVGDILSITVKAEAGNEKTYTFRIFYPREEMPLFEGKDRIFAYESTTVFNTISGADTPQAAGASYAQWDYVGTGTSDVSYRRVVITFPIDKIPERDDNTYGNIYFRIGTDNSSTKDKFTVEHTIKVYGVEVEEYVRTEATYNSLLKGKELTLIDSLTEEDVTTVGAGYLWQFNVTDYVRNKQLEGADKIHLVLELEKRTEENDFWGSFIAYKDNPNENIRPILIPTVYKMDENYNLKNISLTNGVSEKEFNAEASDGNSLVLTVKIGAIDSAKPVRIKPSLASPYATMNIDSGYLEANVGETAVISVTSQSGVTKTYKFVIVSAAEAGYTPGGKLSAEKPVYESDVLSEEIPFKANVKIKNSSLENKQAYLINYFIKDNALEIVKVYKNTIPPGYSSFYGGTILSNTEGLSVISFVVDGDMPAVPVSERAYIGKVDSEFTKKEALAEVYYKDFMKEEITVAGKWNKPNDTLAVYILKNGKSISDFNGTNGSNVFIYAGAVQTDSEGYYGFDAAMNVESNTYNAYITDGEGISKSISFYYAYPEEKRRALNDIYSSESAVDLQSKLALSDEESEYVKLLSIPVASIEGLDEEKLVRVLYNLISANTNTEDFLEMFSDADIIESVNEGKISDISIYNEKTNISEKTAGLFADLSDSEKKNISSVKLAGKSFLSFSEIGTMLETIVAFSSVSSGGNPDSVLDVLTNYSDILGIGSCIPALNSLNSAKKQEVVNAVISGGKYETASDLLKVLAPAINKAAATDSSVGGGGSSPSAGINGGNGSGRRTTVAGGVPESDLSSDVINNEILPKFNDLAGYEWAEEAILWLYGKKVINGVSETRYEPGRRVTREEFLKMADSLYTAESVIDIKFKDVDNNAWYAPYVYKAAKSGIVRGKSENIFGTGDGITREDMAVIIGRILKDKFSVSETDEKFFDDAEISEYAYSDVYYLKAAGIVSGDSNGNYNPSKTVTRAEAAQVMFNIMNVR